MQVALLHWAQMPDTDERPFMGNVGGAGLSTLRILQAGRERGHEITLIGRGGVRAVGNTHFDCAVLSHVGGTPAEVIKALTLIPYVFWEHQYHFCSDVRHISMTCSDKRCTECHIKMAQAFHKNARLSVFQSPLHWRLHTSMGIGPNDPNDYFILPPPIDTHLFHPGVEGPRDPGKVLYVGCMAAHKGMANVVEFVREHPELQFGFCGDSRHDFEDKEWLFSQPNVKNHGSRRNRELPALYAEYGQFIHLPEWIEPSGRSCMEAALIGLNLIWNDRVGTRSFEYPWRNPGMLAALVRDAGAQFWERVEKAVSK